MSRSWMGQSSLSLCSWEIKAGEPEIQGHTWLHDKLKTSLRDGRAYLQISKQTTTKSVFGDHSFSLDH